MKKKTTKIISIILSVLLIFSVMPMTALASDSVAAVTTVTGIVTEYTDIHEAFDYACENAGSTVTLLNDFDLGTDEIHIVDCDITFELNGKTLQGSSDDIIWLHRGGKMTVKDSVGNGSIKNIEDNSFYAITNFGELTIESGKFIGKSAGIFSADRVVIKGGTFIGEEYGLYFWTGESVKIDDECELNIGAEWLDGNGQILGGTFIGGIYIENWDVNGFASKPIRLYLLDILADGYGFFDEDGNEIFATEYQTSLTENITVKKSETERPNVAKVETETGETEYFIDFGSAVSFAYKTNNSTITLLKDTEITGTANFGSYKNFTLDLNGKTLSSSGSTTLSVSLGSKNYTLTIIDSIGGGEIRNTNESGGTSVYVKAGTVMLEGITITSDYGTAVESYFATGITNINGGKISGGTEGVICAVSSTLNINSGVISGGTYGVYLADKAIFNLTNGTISGGTRGVYYKGSGSSCPTICLSGGTINGGIERGSNSKSLDKMLAEGYAFYDNDDNIVDVKDNLSVGNTQIVQKVEKDLIVKNQYPVSVIQPDGTTEYFPSVEEGHDKANESFDSILKLLTDVLLNSGLRFNGSTTLDLNGKKIATNDEYDYTVVVDDGASLNIEDSADNGTIGGGGVAVNGGTLNFNSGAVESTMDGIYNNGGNVAVNGGAISSGYGYDDIFVEGENTTIVYGGAYEDGFSIGGTTINETLADGYVFYNGDGAIEIEDNQKAVSDNVVVYEKTIVTAMSSQIRFNRNDDGSYAGAFDVRTRAKISDADFNKYIAGSTEEAINKISKVGFVYSTAETEFNIDVAKTVAQGGDADGFVDAPVSYIQDADGYYMFTCLVTGIPEEDVDNGLTAYAYICVDGTWYFFPVEVTAEFGEMYSKYYPIAAEQYGWVV